MTDWLFLPWCSEPIAVANGCCSVRTYTGHGINQLFHTAPNVPHYAKNKAVGTMKAGMVRQYITLEIHSHPLLPGIYHRTCKYLRLHVMFLLILALSEDDQPR